MDSQTARAKLKTSIFGQNMFYFSETESTNDYCLKLARDGAPEGTVVVADYQKQGKGRLNRSWFSAKGENLLVSILLRPQQDIESLQKITLASASILIDTFLIYLKKHKLDKIKFNVKWPNDILVGNEKIAGILAESILQEKHINALVVGFGINLNARSDTMPTEIRKRATSLAETIGQPVNIEDFFAELMYHLERSYVRLERSDYNSVVSTWKKQCRQIGKPIIVSTIDGDEEAVFHDVNEDGHLLYKRENGEIAELIAGEIKNR